MATAKRLSLEDALVQWAARMVREFPNLEKEDQQGVIDGLRGDLIFCEDIHLETIRKGPRG